MVALSSWWCCCVCGLSFFLFHVGSSQVRPLQASLSGLRLGGQRTGVSSSKERETENTVMSGRDTTDSSSSSSSSSSSTPVDPAPPTAVASSQIEELKALVVEKPHLALQFRVKAAILEKRLTQRKLSKEVGLGNSSLSRWLNGLTSKMNRSHLDVVNET